jgi:hypothetical protein
MRASRTFLVNRALLRRALALISALSPSRDRACRMGNVQKGDPNCPPALTRPSPTTHPFDHSHEDRSPTPIRPLHVSLHAQLSLFKHTCTNNDSKAPYTSIRSPATRRHGREPVPNWHCQRTYSHCENSPASMLTCAAVAQPEVCISRRHASVEIDVVQAQDCCKARRCLYHNGRTHRPYHASSMLTAAGCRRVWSRKDDLHQHAVLHHHQELCRPQATTPQADGQDGRD